MWHEFCAACLSHTSWFEYFRCLFSGTLIFRFQGFLRIILTVCTGCDHPIPGGVVILHGRFPFSTHTYPTCTWLCAVRGVKHDTVVVCVLPSRQITTLRFQDVSRSDISDSKYKDSLYPEAFFSILHQNFNELKNIPMAPINVIPVALRFHLEFMITISKELSTQLPFRHQFTNAKITAPPGFPLHWQGTTTLSFFHRKDIKLTR